MPPASSPLISPQRNHPEQSRSAAASKGLPPMLRALAMLARLRLAGCQFFLSIRLLDTCAREEIAQRNTAADLARAIDDPLEQTDILARLEAALELAIANDRPALQRQARALLAEFKHQLAEVHARTEREAEFLAIELPASLQATAPCPSKLASGERSRAVRV